MEPVSILAGGIVLLVGFAYGFIVGRVTRRPRRESQVKPICMCTHHYGTHHPKTGVCNAMRVTKAYSTVKGHYQLTNECSCLRYVGPIPVETYWVPPAADMTIVTAPRPLPLPKEDETS